MTDAAITAYVERGLRLSARQARARAMCALLVALGEVRLGHPPYGRWAHIVTEEGAHLYDWSNRAGGWVRDDWDEGLEDEDCIAWSTDQGPAEQYHEQWMIAEGFR